MQLTERLAGRLTDTWLGLGCAGSSDTASTEPRTLTRSECGACVRHSASERALSKSGCKQAAECDVYNCWLDILRMTARGLHVSTAVARERE